MTMPLSSTMSSTSARLLGRGARLSECVMAHPFPILASAKLNWACQAKFLLAHGPSGPTFPISHLADRGCSAKQNRAVLSGQRPGHRTRRAGSLDVLVALEVRPGLR